MSTLIEELKWRGLLKQVSSEEKIKEWDLKKGSLYMGFDPSFKSIHLGNYQSLLVLKHASLHGHKAYALVGSITGMIGDPRDPKLSSSTQLERTLKTKEEIEENVICLTKQMKKYSSAVKIFSNIDFYKDMHLWDYLRDIGKLININYLLEKDVIARRLETGISYAEFSYTLLQGYDFLHLYQTENIECQCGGSDQWGNITTGLEMIRKQVGKENNACCFSIELLLKPDGTKFGKSEGGAIYLDPAITSVYTMYQFLINQEDAMVETMLKRLTFLDEQKIKEIVTTHNEKPYLRYGQKCIATEIIRDIHGEENLQKCIKMSEALFSGNLSLLTSDELYDALSGGLSIEVNNEINILDVLINANICKSKSEVRQLITQNGISVNGKIISDHNFMITKNEAIDNKFSYLKKGKKEYLLIKFSI